MVIVVSSLSLYKEVSVVELLDRVGVVCFDMIVVVVDFDSVNDLSVVI